MLRAFHRRSISQASFALTEEKSAALCSSELGRVVPVADRWRSRVCCAGGVVGDRLALVVFDARWSSPSEDFLTLRRDTIGVWVDRTELIEGDFSRPLVDGCLLCRLSPSSALLLWSRRRLLSSRWTA